MPPKAARKSGHQPSKQPASLVGVSGSTSAVHDGEVATPTPGTLLQGKQQLSDQQQASGGEAGGIAQGAGTSGRHAANREEDSQAGQGHKQQPPQQALQQGQQQPQQQHQSSSGAGAGKSNAPATGAPPETAATPAADGPMKAARHEGRAGPGGTNAAHALNTGTGAQSIGVGAVYDNWGGAGGIQEGSSHEGGTAVEHLMSLLRQHPDHEAAVAAALSAVQNTLRQPPKAEGGRQQQGKRPATGPAGVDFEDEDEQTQQQHQQHFATPAGGAGGRGSGTRKARGKKGADAGASASAGTTTANGGGVAATKKRGAHQQQLHQEQQQQMQQQQRLQQQGGLSAAPAAPVAAGAAAAAAAAATPSAVATEAAEPASAGAAALAGQREAGKGRRGAAGRAARQTAQATPAAGPSASIGADTGAGTGGDAASASVGGASRADPSVPDMANYLEAYPMCNKVLAGIRALPNNTTKTPVSLINEYASRMMQEVVFTEEADTPIGPYTVTCALKEKSGELHGVIGKGRGRNKRDARQVAAAACVEVMLRHVPEVDFFAPAKGTVKSGSVKPGLGYSGRGPGPMGMMKKRRDGDASWSGSFMGMGPPPGPMGGARNPYGGGGQANTWQMQPPPQRSVPFTRATLPSSLPSSYHRASAEVVPPKPQHSMPPHPQHPAYILRTYQSPQPQEPVPSQGQLHALAAALSGTQGAQGPAGAFGMHTLQAGLPLGTPPSVQPHNPIASSQQWDNMTAMNVRHHPSSYTPPPASGALDLSGLQGSLEASGFGSAAGPSLAPGPNAAFYGGRFEQHRQLPQPQQPPQQGGFGGYAPPSAYGPLPTSMLGHQQQQQQQQQQLGPHDPPASSGGWSPWGGPPQQQPVGFSLFRNQ